MLFHFEQYPIRARASARGRWGMGNKDAGEEGCGRVDGGGYGALTNNIGCMSRLLDSEVKNKMRQNANT